MTPICLRNILVLILLSIISALGEAQNLTGRVIDTEGEPLPGAQITLTDQSKMTVTNNKGRFTIELDTLPTIIIIQYLGYEENRKEIQSAENSIEIVLVAKSFSFDHIEVIAEHAKQERSLPALHLDEEFFKEHGDGTFAQAIDVLPGLSSMNVGTGIAKPVIRGLYGNRVLVNQNGIKQEGQQWGNDHGLEIDPFNVERVEILKGPSSLQYGSDAMGGVINIMQKAIPQTNTLNGSVSGLYKTNNLHAAGSAQLRGNYEDFFFSARYSHQNFGDFKVPADEFVYNSFTLPLLDGRVKNTSGRENNIHLSAGYKGKHSITRLTYSRYHLLGGIFAGAVGIPRSYTLQPDGNLRNIAIPFQDVTHEKIVLNQTFSQGDHHWVINVGYQKNRREEHTRPEFHSVRASDLDPNSTLGLGLLLSTWSVNAHYEWHPTEEVKWVLGSNAQWQDHSRSGFEYLLPDYNTFRSGIFGIGEWNYNDQWTFNGGGRWDYGINRSSPFTQLIFNSNETVIDSLSSPLTDNVFNNYSLAIGAHYAPGVPWDLKFNLARSFRIPYLNETVSNGVHHGTFRHEQGEKDLQTEIGWQLDAGLQYQRGGTELWLNTYANFFENYIYLRPTAQFSRLPEAGQLFRYTQHNAFFTGVELQWDQDLWGPIKYQSGFELVYSINLTEKRYLPFTPPSSYIHSFQYHWEAPENKIEGAIVAQHRWTLDQNRVDLNERKTDGYHLFRLQAHAQMNFKHWSMRWDVEVQNVFNTPYLRHLSRYRLLNLPEQGRNLVFRTSIQF
jgi:iron complex outermembrane receptor protein